MRIVVLALLAVVLSAASPPAGVDGDPVALLTAIYKTYTDIGPGEDGVPELSGVYSKRLQALIDKDEKETPEGDVGRIDWDLFVDGQDWQLTELKIVPALKEATRAEVRATLIISANRATFSTRSCWRTAIGASTTSRRR